MAVPSVHDGRQCVRRAGWMIDYGIETKYILCYSNMCLAFSTGLSTVCVRLHLAPSSPLFPLSLLAACTWSPASLCLLPLSPSPVACRLSPLALPVAPCARVYFLSLSRLCVLLDLLALRLLPSRGLPFATTSPKLAGACLPRG